MKFLIDIFLLKGDMKVCHISRHLVDEFYPWNSESVFVTQNNSVDFCVQNIFAFVLPADCVTMATNPIPVM